MFNLAIDSKLRGCDLVRLRISDVVLGGTVRLRTSIIQQKTGRPVPFELTDPTREALGFGDDHPSMPTGCFPAVAIKASMSRPANMDACSMTGWH